MRRGTTPIHTFTTDVDCRSAEVLYITYKQDGKVIVEKTLSDVTIEEDKIKTKLTQEETLRFNPNTFPPTVEIQIRAGFSDDNDTRIASNIITTSVDRILKEGEI